MTKTHLKSGTKLYYIWVDMRQRVNNPNCKRYRHYGGRGIKVCEDWDSSFEIFEFWAITNGYEEGLSIDRIDVNGNYEPFNCRWVTQKVQTRNRRVNNYYEYKGQNLTLADYADMYNLNYRTLRSRIRLGWDITAAIETPFKGRGTDVKRPTVSIG